MGVKVIVFDVLDKCIVWVNDNFECMGLKVEVVVGDVFDFV